MPSIISDPFHSDSLKRDVHAGETVELSAEEEKANKGRLRRTTQRRAKATR